MTTADLLIITLPCGCTKDTDCAHAAHMRQRPELSRRLIEHRPARSRDLINGILARLEAERKAS